MSDHRGLEVACRTHGYERRPGLILPCPWPNCENGTRNPAYAIALIRDELSLYDPNLTEEIAYENRIYEKRAMFFAGDGMRTACWMWVRR